MSHLTERNHKNCLNCNAEVHGKYCHVCGQENLEPNESLWHLITHFFNDITHFDGKFFSTVGLLLTRPGFLSAEYKMGRRNSYLNPVRMYIFTSFVFFLIFFSYFSEEDLFQKSGDTFSIEEVSLMNDEEYKLFVENINNSTERNLALQSASIELPIETNKVTLLRYTDSVRKIAISTTPKLQLERIASLPINEYKILMGIATEMDSVEFANFSKSIYDDTALSKEQLNHLVDSIRLESSYGITVGDTVYRDKDSYDSLINAGVLKENWFERKLRYREFEINDKYGKQQTDFWKHIIEITFHYLPQMLFVSLPLFAFVLKLLYRRNRLYYFVNHGIYSIHLYITYFIALLVFLLSVTILTNYDINEFRWVNRFIVFYLLWYEYKAMRHFYGQRRLKTILKLFLALFLRLIILILMAGMFFGISYLNG